MSKYQLLAAKELIQERRYAEARILLKSINHPTARAWLAKLDKIAPEIQPPPPSPMYAQTTLNTPPSAAPLNTTFPPVSAEAERFYRRENRRANRRRIGNGLYMIMGSIVCFGFFALVFLSKAAVQSGSDTVINLGMECLFIPLGVFAFLAGMYLLLKRD